MVLKKRRGLKKVVLALKKWSWSWPDQPWSFNLVGTPKKWNFCTSQHRKLKLTM